MVLSWVFACAMICKSIVYEKQERLKEMMRVMGLSNGVHWTAWFIDSIVVMIITAVLLSLLLVVSCLDMLRHRPLESNAAIFNRGYVRDPLKLRKKKLRNGGQKQILNFDDSSVQYSKVLNFFKRY
jgi:hypothetical protein